MTTSEFERLLLDREEPLTVALDVLHGVGEWTEPMADDFADAVLAAIESAEQLAERETQQNG